MEPKAMDDRSSTDVGGSDMSRDTQCINLSVRELTHNWINRESAEPPSIPLMIALLVGTIWVGIFLATHWPLKLF